MATGTRVTVSNPSYTDINHLPTGPGDQPGKLLIGDVELVFDTFAEGMVRRSRGALTSLINSAKAILDSLPED